MAKPRTVLVVNPSAQAGQVGKRWATLAQDLRRELDGFEEAMTACRGDATRLAREALLGGAERVVAVGGDGTINEVVNGFFQDGVAVNPEAAFGVIPLGTGGDFRKSAAIPAKARDAARIIAEGKTQRIDVGSLEFTTEGGGTETRSFINVASFGVSGQVVEYANQSSKRLGGKIAFATATLRALAKHQNPRVHLVFDDDHSTALDLTVVTVAVANGRYFGGGMKIAPDAQLDDGAFDVVALGDFSKLEVMRHMPKVYSGGHLHIDGVSHRRAKVVRAEATGGATVLLDMDGEMPGRLPATFRVMPGALSLLCGERRAE